MSVSIVNIYKQTNTPSDFMLMPITSNLDGTYYGEGMVNLMLGLLLDIYYQAESNQQLLFVKGDVNSNGWVPVLGVYKGEKNDALDATEHSIRQSKERGYIELAFWEGAIYFKPTEKCMDLELYTYRKNW